MDIHFIRNNTNLVKENQKKRFLSEKIVDEILDIDSKWRTTNFDVAKLQAMKNKLSSCYKNAPSDETIFFNDIYTYDKFIASFDKTNLAKLTPAQIKDLSIHIGKIIVEKENNELLDERDRLMSQLGNKLDDNVLISNNEEKNPVIYMTEHNSSNVFKYDHVKLGELLGIIDTKNGIEVAGNRGYFLVGLGVRLNLALLSYATDFLASKDYQLMATPHFVVRDLMAKITQLNEYDETLYGVKEHDVYHKEKATHDKFLIATSEQPLTALFNNKNISKKDLPIKYAGISSCYRKETGRHGQQTLGIFRVHQFEKVEQFCVTEPEKSPQMFQNMIDTAKEFYNSLEFEFRIVNIVSGALNNVASIKYDIEAYFPASKFYGELVSCTNCLDYFSKRLGTKIIGSENYVHMLNSTLLANTRVICCLLETFQTDNGVKIPKVLQRYMGCDFIKFKD